MIKISRNAVEKSLLCKRCFFLEYKYKIKPHSVPFTLNNAVDNLCKKEFDIYIKKKKPHPYFLKYNIDAIPFDHPEIDNWRNNRKGIFFKDYKNKFHFFGAIDDVWIKPNGQLIVSDIKATSKNEFNWEAISNYNFSKGYKRQIEMYQWLFRKNGFDVSNTGYLVYFNGLRNEKRFDQKLQFEIHMIKLECNDDWVQKAILKACELLNNNSLPTASKKCSTCLYLKDRWKLKNKIS